MLLFLKLSLTFNTNGFQESLFYKTGTTKSIKDKSNAKQIYAKIKLNNYINNINIKCANWYINDLA